MLILRLLRGAWQSENVAIARKRALTGRALHPYLLDPAKLDSPLKVLNLGGSLVETGCGSQRKGEFSKAASRPFALSPPMDELELLVGILTVSDRASSRVYEDKTGPALKAAFTQAGSPFFARPVRFTEAIVPDEIPNIVEKLVQWSDVNRLHLILTTGGTGFSPRDQTPEATRQVLHREAPGLQIAMIQASLVITPHAMLARPMAGTRNRTIIVNLPGSPKGAVENLRAILAGLPHALALLLDLPKSNESHHKLPFVGGPLVVPDTQGSTDLAAAATLPDTPGTPSHHHAGHNHTHSKVEVDAEASLLAQIERKDIVQVVEAQALSTQAIAGLVSSDKAGAVSLFVGTTRDHHNGKKVLKLEYEAYIPMAEKEMKKIAAQIRSRWNVIHVALFHRIGEVGITAASVVVAISSVHRKDSLEACHYAIDEIKAHVPIWKKEFYEDGSAWKENQEWRDSHRC